MLLIVADCYCWLLKIVERYYSLQTVAGWCRIFPQVAARCMVRSACCCCSYSKPSERYWPADAVIANRQKDTGLARTVVAAVADDVIANRQKDTGLTRTDVAAVADDVKANRQKDTDLASIFAAAVADVVKANSMKDTDLASTVVAADTAVAGCCRMPAWAGAIHPTPPPWFPGLQHDTAARTL